MEIFTTIHGSRLYGTENGKSDWDYYRVVANDPKVRKWKPRQLFQNGNDITVVSLDTFLQHLSAGVPQAVEALFSRKKEWGRGADHYKAILDSYRLDSYKVEDTYLRTIQNFAISDSLKVRKHAVRLAYNLKDFKEKGEFNPSLTGIERLVVNLLPVETIGSDFFHTLMHIIED